MADLAVCYGDACVPPPIFIMNINTMMARAGGKGPYKAQYVSSVTSPGRGRPARPTARSESTGRAKHAHVSHMFAKWARTLLATHDVGNRGEGGGIGTKTRVNRAGGTSESGQTGWFVK